MVYSTDTDRSNVSTEEEEKFLSYFRKSSLPKNPNEWGSPIAISESSRAPYIVYDLDQDKKREDPAEANANMPNSSRGCFPLNGEVVEFSGPLFEGKIVSRVRHMPEGEGEGWKKNKQYFEGRKRLYNWTVQGKFKERIRFDNVLTGQDLGRPFRNAPSASLVKKGLDLLKTRLPESFKCDLFSETPQFEHPLLAGCQSFRIDHLEKLDYNDTQCLIGANERGDIIEDTSLLNDPSIPEDSVSRKKFFSKTENLEKYFFETEYIYTFDFFANFFSPATYRLEPTSFFHIDLIPYFNGYPLFFAMAKEKNSGKYFFATEMWHRRLLDYNEKPATMLQYFTGRK